MNIKNFSKNLALSAIVLQKLIENTINKEIEEKGDKITSSSIGQLFSLYITFKENLIYDLTAKEFGDIFAQTIVFSMLFAKINTKTEENLNINNISNRFFDSFPLIKSLLQFFTNLEHDKYFYLKMEINKLCHVLNDYDIKKIFIFDKQYIEFYEYFLTIYDKSTKVDRGVFYTPACITEFIIREVNLLLKNNFYCEDGISDSRIKILDFACGTGSFLLEIYKQCNQIIDNVYGFELIIAPYIIANLRLSEFLKTLNLPIKKLPIFLTNTLEDNKNIKFSAISEITLEANKAQEIKNKNICVIVGNPPYSIKSQNNNPYINSLMEEYFYINGKKVENSQALHDDYIKFIRFAEDKISKCPFGGIVSIVVNHGFIDNPSFKAMRLHLLDTFDDMYFVDLNGNFRRQKFTIMKEKDENLFPVKQGICIAFFIKYPPDEVHKKNVYHTEIIANKENKAAQLKKITLQNKTLFKIANPTTPFYSFKPSDESARYEYDQGINIIDIFLEYGNGITTSRDGFAMDICRKKLLERFLDFKNSMRNDLLYEKFKVAKKKGWDILKIHDKFQNYSDAKIENLIKPIHFRGFDIRYIMYDSGVIASPSFNIMQHLVNDNVGICFAAREIDSVNYSSIFVTNKLLSFAMHYYGAKLAPMYLYKNGQKIPNFKQDFLSYLQQKYKTEITPEKVFAYIYGILFSQQYRTKYITFLSIDYPKVPFVSTFEEFIRLSDIGQKLIELHLLTNIPSSDIRRFVGDNYIIENVIYKNNRIYINSNSYFDNVCCDVYKFKIGCYPVVEKYLKPRKNIDISMDLSYIESIIDNINMTICLL